MVPDPVLLIEILSPSNEAQTRANIWAYTTIPSVREILAVHSTRIEAELLRRNPDGSWPEEPPKSSRPRIRWHFPVLVSPRATRHVLPDDRPGVP